MAIGKVSILFLVLSIVVATNFFWRSALRFLLDEKSITEIDEAKKLLIIGVMSAQDHFKERESVRNTWRQHIQNNLVDYKFLIGKNICSIPLEDRITPYSCEKWNITLPYSHSGNLSIIQTNNASVISDGFSGFSFIVKHNISVNKLGINAQIFKNTNYKIFRMVLVDAASGNKLSSATFNNQDYSREGFVWKSISSIDLPENFEGLLKIVSEKNINVNCSVNILNNGVIHVFEVIKNNKFLIFNEPVCSLVGLIYIIQNSLNLKKFIDNKSMRQSNWDDKIVALQYHLEIEENAYNDILYLDLVDVYKNLTLKLFEFLKWTQISSSYQYILKTDDDVFLDINRILSALMMYKDDDWDWWSCFRQGYNPPNYGKWRDRLYGEPHYPLFPSGAGYVIANSVVSDLVSKKAVDNPTVGEDVAVGIWMKNGLKRYPKKLNTTYAYWACGETCASIHPYEVEEEKEDNNVLPSVEVDINLCSEYPNLETSTINAGDVIVFYIDPVHILSTAGNDENIMVAEKNNSDLVEGVYEGGLKVWECTYDIVNYLCSHNRTMLSEKLVLDLGCGSGILGILAYKLGATEVHFQDYNQGVIKHLTMPNVARNGDNLLKKSKFWYGDWKSFSLLNHTKYDVILTSETIYNTFNYKKLLSVFKNCLKSEGVIILGAKTHYFGLGGGLKQFQDFIENCELLCCENIWKSESGVFRGILKITNK